MATEMAGNVARPQRAPTSAPANQPKSEPKKAADSKAAKETPKETKAAAKSAFGDPPAAGNAKEGARNDAAKTPRSDAMYPASPKLPSARQPKTSNLAPQTKTGTSGSPGHTTGDAEPAPAPKGGSGPDAKTPAPPAGDAEGKAPAAPASGDVSETPAVPGTGDGAKTPPSPGTDAGAKTPAGASAGLPTPAEPVDDPKQSENEEAISIFPAVDASLSFKDENGKTVIDLAQAETLMNLKAYNEDRVKRHLPPDAISKYYRYKLAETAAKLGLPTGPDPQDPRMPKTTVYQIEKTTGDIFDMAKIQAGIKEAENDPAVQQFLADKQRESMDNQLDTLINEGKIPDVPKDPVTGSRAKYLADKQHQIINDPKLAEAIAKMPLDKQQEAIRDAVGPLAEFGATINESRSEVVNLINRITDITGQPKPVVDANNLFVVTPEGDPVVKNPESGTNIALGKDGRPLSDEVTKLPIAYGDDGRPLQDQLGRKMSIAPGGSLVAPDKDGNLQVLGTDVYGNKYTPLTNPVNQFNRIILDKNTGAPVELDYESGKAVADPLSGLPKVIDVKTALPLTNPATGNPIVADPASTAAVEVDQATGKIVTDGAGNAVVVDPHSGYRVQDQNGNLVVADKDSKLPVIVDPTTGIKTVMNPGTGRPLADPAKGTTIILDPDSKMPVVALTSKETGELIKNTNGQIAQIDSETGLPVLVDATDGTRHIVDPATGLVLQDPNGNLLHIDKRSGLAIAKGADGKDVVEANTGAKLVYNPKTGLPIGKPDYGTYTVLEPKSGMPLEVDAKGNYTVDTRTGMPAVMNVTSGQNLVTEDGKQVLLHTATGRTVVDDNGKSVLVDPLTGEYVVNPVSQLKTMLDPKTSLPVYQDPTSGDSARDRDTGGLQVVDPKTGLPLMDPLGNKVQIDPETGQQGVYNPDTGKFEPKAPAPVPLLDEAGGQITFPDGSTLAKDGTTGNTILLDPLTKQPVTEAKSGLVQITDAKGNALVDPAGNKVVIDKDTGAPVAVDATGKMIVDPKGNTQVYSGTTGKQVTDAAGNPVVLDQMSGAPILTDKATGEPVVDPKSGLTYVADPVTGGVVTDKETGNTVVLEKESKAPVLQAPDGTIVQDAEGNSVLANSTTGKAATDPDGNQILVDKNAGVPIVVDPQTGDKLMVDGTGAPMKEPKTGAIFMIGKHGLPMAVLDKDGTRIVIDPSTGEQAVDGSGNKVYVDPTTGQMVTNSPTGVIDILTGMPPEIRPPQTPPSETVDKIFKAIRNSIGSVYWGTFGVALGKFSVLGMPMGPASQELYNNTKNFHASRMVASASGVATMVMAAVRWAPGTEMRKMLDAGNVQEGLLFGEDLSAVFKYFGFYPKTADGLVKYFADRPRPGSDNMQILRDPDGGTIVKTNTASTRFIQPGGVNPVTGEVMPAGGPVQIAPGYTTSIFVKKDQINPLTGAVAKKSEWINLPDGVYDPNTGVAGLRGQPRAPATTSTPTTYARYAANALTKAVSNVANLSMGLGNFIGGGLQLYKGGKQMAEGVKADDAAMIMEGFANIIGGTAFTIVGMGGAASAVTEMGAFGKTLARPITWLLGKLATATNIAGVGLFVANFATAIAGIIGLARDPQTLAKTYELWADAVLKTFDGADVFKGGRDAAEANLEDWYKNFAHPYYNEKMREVQKDDYSQDGSNPNNAGYGRVPNGA